MKFLPGLLVCLLCVPAAYLSAQSPAAGPGSAAATPPSYAGESFVVERLSNDVVFAADGTGHEEQTMRVRILSDAALEEFGILRISYRSDNQRVDVQATVTANGTVVSTPLADIQDLPSDVSREAPMYSDTREKHVPVRGLRVGSVLEYRVRLTRTKPDTPGFFWFTHFFTTGNIVLDETLNITVPSDKYVQVKSPQFTPAVEQRGGTKVYSWKNANTSRSPDNKIASSTAPPDVQLTSFRNWDDVGRWYRDLQSPQIAITPAIKAKAAELTAGLASDVEKQKAIYRFVATNFRYISLSFGQGRYQPHTAGEVLANAYGDCKDKHTLMTSLLTAAGLHASPALLAVGGSIDVDVPSPAAMNHVITYLPGTQPTWVDTTTEVAPYGALPSYIRGVRALVIPETGAAFLATTPERLPFASETSFLTTGTLTADGLLSGRTSASYRGDTELQMRAAFRVTSRGEWPQLLARVINVGTVREDKVEDPLNLDPPFTYSYAFERRDFFKPAQAMFLLPLPLISRSYNPAAEKPAEPVFVGSAGDTTVRATLSLPEGFSAEVPTDVSVKTAFGDYVTSYRMAGNVLTAERHLVLKQERVAPAEWSGFQAFFKSISDDEQQYVALVRRTRDVPVVVRSSKEANELILKARDSILARDSRRTLELLGQAERINPTERLLWAAYATVYGIQGQAEKALDAMKKEVLYHPDEREMYRMLIDLQVGMHRTDEAITSLREVLTLNPADVEAAVRLSSFLVDNGKHAEAISVAETAIRAGASDPELRIALGHALLGAGRKAEGATIIVKALEGSADSSALNNAAYALAEDGVELPAAADLANRSAAKLAADSSQLALVSLTESDLHNVLLLTMVWDTQGWVAFKRGDLKTAETFLSAAWTWTQRAVIGYHLGQVYEAQHNRALAIRTYQLAREANVPRNEHIGQQIKDRLDKMALGNAAANSSSDVAGDLSRMRTVAVPNKTGGATGQADFLILLSKKGVEDVALVTGTEGLRPMTKAITALRFDLPFPDDGPERMVRRGILSCPTAGSNCSMILLLTGDTTK
jgi:transglutaminase-like putative cysteine protease/Flp pilus assembly protein TadD